MYEYKYLEQRSEREQFYEKTYKILPISRFCVQNFVTAEKRKENFYPAFDAEGWLLKIGAGFDFQERGIGEKLR